MTHREAFTNIIHPCWVRVDGRYRRSRVFCKVEWDGERLSITGVIGPRQSGNADGGCGQIDMEFRHTNPRHDSGSYSYLIPPTELDFTTGWDADKWQDFLAIWKIYHLNNMQAGCKHQQALGWTYKTHAQRNCPVCGYRIGTAWKDKPVPTWALTLLRELPNTEVIPAWV